MLLLSIPTCFVVTLTDTVRLGGKVLREGMGQTTGLPTSAQLDTVITNALIVDYTGIYKADVGIKNGIIVGKD